MAQKRKTEQSKLIAEAALALADRGGWGSLTFAAIARKAKVKQTDIEKKFSDIWDILAFVLRNLEDETARTVDGYLGDNWRDNIMEILMTRFDIAARHRGAFSSLAKDLPKQPKALRRFVRTFYDTMGRILEKAGLPVSPLRPLQVAAFGAFYVSIVDVWIKDDTRDQSKTMAAIDKRLGFFDSAMGYFSCKK